MVKIKLADGSYVEGDPAFNRKFVTIKRTKGSGLQSLGFTSGEGSYRKVFVITHLGS